MIQVCKAYDDRKKEGASTLSNIIMYVSVEENLYWLIILIIFQFHYFF